MNFVGFCRRPPYTDGLSYGLFHEYLFYIEKSPSFDELSANTYSAAPFSDRNSGSKPCNAHNGCAARLPSEGYLSASAAQNASKAVLSATEGNSYS